MRTVKNILITGGCGFIGTNFIKMLLDETPSFTGRVVNIDKLTYAGHPENLAGYEQNSRYYFVEGDINNRALIDELLIKYQIDTVCHFAAESHVDNSITDPYNFIQTNIVGTFTLLEACRHAKHKIHFHHISTDEVYGSLGSTGFFYEDTAYNPRSPYSASKAGSDHLVMAYHHTYKLSVTLSNCSNNYGPYQDREKLIPLMIGNLINKKPLPVYGKGLNIRDWVHVRDHNQAVWLILNKGAEGKKYNIGSCNEQRNIDLVNKLCELVAKHTGEQEEALKALITYVKDRAGHDFRYAINCDAIAADLGWHAAIPFDEGLEQTVLWYIEKYKAKL
jgi:dTDP-glucose 4,6-dehydratase